MKSLNQQRGAILLSVLIISVILAILISTATTLMQSRFSIAENSQLLLREKAATYSKINELAYLVSTQRITPAGVSTGKNTQALARNDDAQWLFTFTGDEIRADGVKNTEQVNGTSVNFSIQADNGLIPLNTSEQFWLKTWLSSYGLAPVEQARLADSLADYADSDDWVRPSGAESNAYRGQANMPPNFLLQQCTELHAIQHWSDFLAQHPS